MKHDGRQRFVPRPQSRDGVLLPLPWAPPAGEPASLTHWPGRAAALMTARQGMEAASTAEDAIHLALEAAARTLHGAFVAFWRFDAGSGRLCLADWAIQTLGSHAPEGALAVPLVSTASLELLQRGVDLDWTGVIDGAAALQRATVAAHQHLPAPSGWSRLARGWRCPLELWVPVRLPEHGWGRLSVLRPEESPFDAADAVFLEALAHELGWVLADKRLEELGRLALFVSRKAEVDRALALARQQAEAAQAQAREQAHVIAVLQEAIDSLDRSGDLDAFVPTVIGLIARALSPGAVALLQVRAQRCRLRAAWLQGQVLQGEDMLAPAGLEVPALLRELAVGFELPPSGLQACAPQGGGESLVVDHAEAGTMCPFDRFFTTEGGPLALNLPLMASGHALGALGIYRRREQRYTPSEIALAEAIAAQLSLALRAGELAEEARRVATLEERTRLAREMHDTLAQGFTGVLMQLEVADAAVAAHRVDRARTAIATAMEVARDSLGEARRAVRALRNPTLERRGLAEALAELCAQMRSSTFQAVELEVVGARRRLDAHAEEQVLRVAQEALVNAVRHARAHRARVLLRFAADALLLQVRDDGEGIPEQGANPVGFGLVGMRERALSIGATLEIESRPGQGTTVSLRIGAVD